MRYSIATVVAVLWSLQASQGFAQTPPPPPADAPPPAMPPPEPAAKPPEPGKGPVEVKSKWGLTIAGWVQADAVYDTTQSYGQASGGAIMAKPGTYTGDHDRMQLYMQNSRIGFRGNAPEFNGLKVSGFIEFDFNGNQPAGLTETATFSNATLRARHVWVKAESEAVDFLAGQTWHLFGWQPFFHPNTLQLQGVPGQVFTRSVQFRLSKVVKADAVNFEIAVAGVRPPQRDAAIPDGQAGLKLGVNQWKGVHTGGAGAGSTVDGATLGVSGLFRSFRVINPNGSNSSKKATGWGISLDAMIPVIPVTGDDKGNKLTLQGSFQTGSGFNDQYSGLTGGSVTGGPAGYTANIDNGFVRFDSAGELHTIDWKIFLIDLQYYFPNNGNIWLSANYSQMESGNIKDFGANPATVYTKMWWYDINLFMNLTPAFRLGAEYAFGKQTMGDDSTRSNIRGQFSAFYIF
jgi:hypothetical protein